MRKGKAVDERNPAKGLAKGEVTAYGATPLPWTGDNAMYRVCDTEHDTNVIGAVPELEGRDDVRSEDTEGR